MYEAALRIITNGLGMKMADILPGVDLERETSSQTLIHQFDIDAMYERHIKGT